MPIFYENLFASLLSVSLDIATEAQIITGYISGKFIDKLANLYPKVKFTVFVGMSKQGVVKDEHELLKSIVLSHNNVTIFYQVFDRPTHMKIYRFKYIGSWEQYIGSANLSENGFELNREILVKVDENLDNLFEIQKTISKNILAPDIGDYITFVEDEVGLVQSSPYHFIHETEVNTYITKNDINDSTNNRIESEKSNVRNTGKILLSNISNNIRTRILNSPKSIVLTLALSEDKDPHWKTTRLNATTNQELPYLEANTRDDFSDLFNEGQVSALSIDRFGTFDIMMGGKYNRRLVFQDDSFVNDLKSNLNLDSNDRISYDLLKQHGLHYLTVGKVNGHYYGVFNDKPNRKRVKF